MGLSDIAKAPVSHGVEPHDLETGPSLPVVLSRTPSPLARRPYRASGLVPLREAEDAGPSKALRPTRAHKVVGCVTCSLPQCRVGREFHEKGSSAASLAVCGRKLESVTPTSRTPFGGGNWSSHSLVHRA